MQGQKEPKDRLALSLLGAGRLKEARQLAEELVEGQCVLLPAHSLLVTILMRHELRDDAEAVIRRALELRPGTGDAYDALAFVSARLGAHERANVLYRQAVEVAPKEARFWHNLASSERSFGRLSEAEAACDRSIQLDPKHAPAYLLRSELRVQSNERNHVKELQGLLASPTLNASARMFIGYALGKELDDLKRYSEAYKQFASAALIRRSRVSYDVATDERKLLRIAEVYDDKALRVTAPVANSARFIFIVGLPRSGTTLLERILTALSNVKANGETDNFSTALLKARPRGADVFSSAAAADPVHVAAEYQRLANPTDSAHHYIEKLPLNYLYVGAIYRALPGARFIWMRRDPIDNAFAMYRTLFGDGYPFSYDFEDLARYCAAQQALMNHWVRELPGVLYQVHYENLVRNPLTIAHGAASHCGLTWDPAAVDVTRNQRVSTTASAAQVRRAIYGSSAGRWRHYSAELAPLIEALTRYGVVGDLEDPGSVASNGSPIEQAETRV